jgi:hypothetical protein
MKIGVLSMDESHPVIKKQRSNPMIEIRFSTEPSDNTLITFDGKVLEFFSVVTRGSTRIHVFEIANIEVATDAKGRNRLNITSKYVNSPLLTGQTVRPEVLAETEALVAAVRQAMAAYV